MVTEERTCQRENHRKDPDKLNHIEAGNYSCETLSFPKKGLYAANATCINL